jgi:hypothetical protein
MMRVITKETRMPARNIWIAVVAASVVWACASATVEPARELADESTIVKPSIVLVYDFAVRAEDSANPTTKEQREALAKDRKIARSLSEVVISGLNEKGIDSRLALAEDVPPVEALLLKGRFITIDEGSTAGRMLIGFGVGAQELRVQIETYQATAGGSERPLAISDASADSGSMPGMAVPVAAGAAVGNVVVSAAVSGGMATFRELGGPMQTSVKQLGDAITERGVAFYERKGWL